MNERMSLSKQQCVELPKTTAPLTPSEAAALVTELSSAWVIGADNKSLQREFKVKGFAKAVYLTNSACFIADQQNHHPDIELGWGYCRIRYTTHSVGGLSLNDFICAARLDALVDS